MDALWPQAVPRLFGHRPSDARRLNSAKALELLRFRPQSRAELARHLGLSKSALGDLVSDLISLGLVLEDAPIPTQRGRYPAPLRINAQRFAVLAVDLAAEGLDVSLRNPLGMLIEARRSPLDESWDREKVFGVLLELAGELVRASPFPVVAVGVAAPGPLDYQLGRILTPPHLPSLHSFPLKERLETALGLPVILEHDSNAAAWQFMQATSAENFIYILIGRGIGAGIVIGRQIYRGVHGLAGELGHISLELEGEPCSCGNRGCLELAAGTEAIEARYARLAKRPAPLEEVAALARLGDERAALAFAHAGELLGAACVGLVNLLDPELLVLGGRGAAYADLILPSLKEHLAHRAYPYLGWGERLSIAVDAEQQPVSAGAAEVALRAVYDGMVGLPSG
jgi:predicted NBD/HSP70 family sugar kinase